ncbi:hypothetical protein [Mucilaginibacter humi]|uniref:hypothetical protein n=1 Tax=Mucilaginibacter humi TaxID=2732510 RepID=UPI001FE6382E|nr:hypothetical protein [Mucilaginibacter humi]
MKFKNPIGQVVNDLGNDWHIVGVVKDFILTNPYEPTRPILICGAKPGFMQFDVIQIKFNGQNPMADNLKKRKPSFRNITRSIRSTISLLTKATPRSLIMKNARAL